MTNAERLSFEQAGRDIVKRLAKPQEINDMMERHRELEAMPIRKNPDMKLTVKILPQRL